MSQFKPLKSLWPLTLSLAAVAAGARPVAALTQQQYLVITDTYYSATARARMTVTQIKNRRFDVRMPQEKFG